MNNYFNLTGDGYVNLLSDRQALKKPSIRWHEELVSCDTIQC